VIEHAPLDHRYRCGGRDLHCFLNGPPASGGLELHAQKDHIRLVVVLADG
jgi:hypothetical protein